jgi:hypothetical protein
MIASDMTGSNSKQDMASVASLAVNQLLCLQFVMTENP